MHARRFLQYEYSNARATTGTPVLNCTQLLAELYTAAWTQVFIDYMCVEGYEVCNRTLYPYFV